MKVYRVILYYGSGYYSGSSELIFDFNIVLNDLSENAELFNYEDEFIEIIKNKKNGLQEKEYSFVVDLNNSRFKSILKNSGCCSRKGSLDNRFELYLEILFNSRSVLEIVVNDRYDMDSIIEYLKQLFDFKKADHDYLLNSITEKYYNLSTDEKCRLFDKYDIDYSKDFEWLYDGFNSISNYDTNLFFDTIKIVKQDIKNKKLDWPNKYKNRSFFIS